jgi:hypothetical protein
MAFRDLDMWWLAGMPISQARDWFPYVLALTGTADITNTFLDFGLKAGLPAALLLISLLVLSYRHLGQALHAPGLAPGSRFLLWGLGCTLAVHIATWLGITYFDQIAVIWYLHLAMVTTLARQLVPSSAPLASRHDEVLPAASSMPLPTRPGRS